MTSEEATSVCSILVEADGGCQVCAGALFRLFIRYWPQFTSEADKVWEDQFEGYTYKEEKGE